MNSRLLQIVTACSLSSQSTGRFLLFLVSQNQLDWNIQHNVEHKWHLTSDLRGMFLAFFSFFNIYFYCIFPLPFIPLTPYLPPQSPHCFPCPWVYFPFCSISLMPRVVSLLSMSLSLFHLLIQAVLRFHIWVKSYGVCLSLTGLFHLA